MWRGGWGGGVKEEGGGAFLKKINTFSEVGVLGWGVVGVWGWVPAGGGVDRWGGGVKNQV